MVCYLFCIFKAATMVAMMCHLSRADFHQQVMGREIPLIYLIVGRGAPDQSTFKLINWFQTDGVRSNRQNGSKIRMIWLPVVVLCTSRPSWGTFRAPVNALVLEFQRSKTWWYLQCFCSFQISIEKNQASAWTWRSEFIKETVDLSDVFALAVTTWRSLLYFFIFTFEINGCSTSQLLRIFTPCFASVWSFLRALLALLWISGNTTAIRMIAFAVTQPHGKLCWKIAQKVNFMKLIYLASFFLICFGNLEAMQTTGVNEQVDKSWLTYLYLDKRLTVSTGLESLSCSVAWSKYVKPIVSCSFIVVDLTMEHRYGDCRHLTWVHESHWEPPSWSSMSCTPSTPGRLGLSVTAFCWKISFRILKWYGLMIYPHMVYIHVVKKHNIYIYIYIYMCMCVCMCKHMGPWLFFSVRLLISCSPFFDQGKGAEASLGTEKRMVPGGSKWFCMFSWVSCPNFWSLMWFQCVSGMRYLKTASFMLVTRPLKLVLTLNNEGMIQNREPTLDDNRLDHNCVAKPFKHL